MIVDEASSTREPSPPLSSQLLESGKIVTQGDYHIILEQTMSLYARNRVRKEPGICGGALSIPEERMPVSFILRCFAAGMSQREMLRAYPQLSEEDLRLALLAAAEKLEQEDEAAAG
jgi:uncharacterized protein (DUF433 family)